MAKSICDIAVISIPRSGSKSLVDIYCEKYHKLPAYGVLHTPKYLGKNDYDVEAIIKGHKHVLHGHWHTINELAPELQAYIRDHYRIVTVTRPMLDILSSLDRIIDLPYEQVEDILADILDKSSMVYDKWDIEKSYEFHKLYN